MNVRNLLFVAFIGVLQLTRTSARIGTRAVDPGDPNARCPASCPHNLAWVCGTDGISYPNDCLLGVAHCLDKRVKKKANGKCPRRRPVDPATRCPQICTRELMWVCGSNGVSYPNECELDVAHCLDNRITKKADGQCPQPPLIQ